ncbi:MAG: hypothetical protein ACKVRP_05270 [Bacteroidota bacterium]
MRIHFSYVIVGFWAFTCIFGCGRQSESHPPRVDTLSVEREQLLMINHLPLGLSYNDVKLRFPSLGEVRNGSAPGQALTGIASGTMRVMTGWDAIVEMKFEDDALIRYSFVITGDSMTSATTYGRLQSFYTMQFGNYHQELQENGDQRLMRSYWTSDVFAVVVVSRDSSGNHSLSWGFEKLPTEAVEQPEANAGLPFHSHLAVTEE